MNIYIACPWVDRAQAIDVAGRLREIGHTITHEWWKFETTGGEYGGYDHTYSQRCAWWDFIGVSEADILLLLNLRTSEGKCVEQGIALALGKPILAVGERGRDTTNIFHHLQAYTWVPTIADALTLLHPDTWRGQPVRLGTLGDVEPSNL